MFWVELGTEVQWVTPLCQLLDSPGVGQTRLENSVFVPLTYHVTWGDIGGYPIPQYRKNAKHWMQKNAPNDCEV